MLHLVVVSPIRKEKKRKRNINNDLAVLPSHDTVPPWPLIRIKCLSLPRNSSSHRSISLMIPTTGSLVVWLILLSLGMCFLQPLSLLTIPGLDFPLKLPLHDYLMLILHLSAHSMRTLLFLISVVTFLIHSYLMSDMRKFSRIYKIFAIAILIRVKVRLEFSVLFSLSRYIFFVYFSVLSISLIFIYIYISLL